MSAHRTSISINKDLYEAGMKNMKGRYFDNFSDYVATLIREDVEAAKLKGISSIVQLNEDVPQYAPAPATSTRSATAIQDTGSGKSNLDKVKDLAKASLAARKTKSP